MNTRGRSYKILANVEINDPNCSGVIFAHGSRFGGHTLFIKDKKLYYVYNFLGIKPEQQFVSPELKPGKYTLGMEFKRESAGKYGESVGKAKLYVNDKVVAEGPMKTQPGKFTLSGDGLCIGRDSGDNVSQEYKAPGTFTGGTILAVGSQCREEGVPGHRAGGRRTVGSRVSQAAEGRNVDTALLEAIARLLGGRPIASGRPSLVTRDTAR